MVIAAAPSTADTPRAHTNNPQAMGKCSDPPNPITTITNMG